MLEQLCARNCNDRARLDGKHMWVLSVFFATRIERRKFEKNRGRSTWNGKEDCVRGPWTNRDFSVSQSTKKGSKRHTIPTFFNLTRSRSSLPSFGQKQFRASKSRNLHAIWIGELSHSVNWKNGEKFQWTKQRVISAVWCENKLIDRDKREVLSDLFWRKFARNFLWDFWQIFNS
jgi:hypothetical protein